MYNSIKDLMRSLMRLMPGNRDESADGFPLVITGHWYTGSWYMWLCKADVLSCGDSMSGDKANKVSPAEGEVAFNHRRCGISSDDTSNLIDGLIPAIKIGDKVGLYKVTKGPYLRKDLLSDPAGWDDCKEIDLKFVKAV